MSEKVCAWFGFLFLFEYSFDVPFFVWVFGMVLLSVAKFWYGVY